MSRYDLAGNPLPESGPASAPSAAPPPPAYTPAAAAPPAYAPRVTAPAPAAPMPAPAPWQAPVAPQNILTRGVVQETPAQKVRAYGGLLGTFLLLIVLTYAVAAIPAPHAAPPSSYNKRTVDRGGFTYDAPDGWKRERLDEGMMTHVVYENHKAIVQISYIPTEMVGASSAPSPAEAHSRGLGVLTDELGDADIHDQPAQPVTTGLGDESLSEWTTQEGVTHLHGVRATLVAPGVEAFVTCFCPERDWALLRPSFLHVIQSAAPLNGAQPPQAGAPSGGQ